MNAFFDEDRSSSVATTETGIKEAAEIGLRFSWDQMSGDTVTERADAEARHAACEGDRRERDVPLNRFAGLVPEGRRDGRGREIAPVAKEIREIVASLLRAGREVKSDRGGLSREFHPDRR